MDYKEVELYGRKIRVYSENHIEMEFCKRVGDWRRKSIYNASNGYRRIEIDVKRKTHYVSIHRLIFYVHNPSWDIYDSSMDNFIDHKNGERADNRIENLQCVSHQENQLNRTKAKGYCWREKRKKWESTIRVNGKNIYLGRFAKESDAREAYLSAKLKYHIIEERVF